MLTFVWAHIPHLVGYGSRDLIASHIVRLFHCWNIADSRKAKSNIVYEREKENTKQKFKERDFLPVINDLVSIPSI
jgi:hypothetical protein